MMENTIPKILREVAKKYPDLNAQRRKDEEGNFQPVKYKELLQLAYSFGAGLLSLGVKRGDHVGIIADDRVEWFQADMGIMGIGAIDVPRGCDAPEKDIAYILSFTDCEVVVAENNFQVKKILSVKNEIPTLKSIIYFDDVSDDVAELAKKEKITLYKYFEILEKGDKYRKENSGVVEAEFEKGDREDLACIIFTSGTTGEPKGVMLQHKNFIVQLDELVERIPLEAGCNVLCILPVWHVFQRLCEYVMMIKGTCLCYSKPIGSVLLADIQKVNPIFIPGVPRVFEAVYEGIYKAMRKKGGITNILFKFFTNIAIIHSRMDKKMFRKEARFRNDFLVLKWILFFIPWLLLYPLRSLGDVLVYRKVRAKFGNNFKGCVSGGGALPPNIDEFFWALGLNIVEGYGLTETAPVVSVRPVPKPIFGTTGSPIRGVNVRIVDDGGNILGPGQKGTVQIKGETVMKGYYKKPELTAKVIDADGWFDTGDIGMTTVTGELVLLGRKKDTIVLRGGENVEPLPIEMKMNESKYIATSVVVGQDQRNLAALIVPSEDEIIAFAKENSIQFKDYNELLKNAEIIKMIDNEIQNLINSKNGFRLFERIGKFALLSKPFEVGVELSAKQEIMRYKMQDIYAKEMKTLFN
ncbi:MAG: long-chain fatty acid--CoA ligase [Treponema sp.]|nr:long-chain fatty acid--CoA ligase [Treponema sp.]